MGPLMGYCLPGHVGYFGKKGNRVVGGTVDVIDDTHRFAVVDAGSKKARLISPAAAFPFRHSVKTNIKPKIDWDFRPYFPR